MDEKELLTVWLADKVLDIVENEDDVKRDAIRYVEKVIKSGKWWQMGVDEKSQHGYAKSRNTKGTRRQGH